MSATASILKAANLVRRHPCPHHCSHLSVGSLSGSLRSKAPAGSSGLSSPGRERVARARQLEMIRIERVTEPKVNAALHSQSAEAGRRIAMGLDPVPLEYRTKWSRELYRSQIRGGAQSSILGWSAASSLLSGAKQVGAETPEAFVGIGAPEDFLRSPVDQEVDGYFRATSRKQAQSHADQVNKVFERVKNRESIDPVTGKVDLTGLDMGKVARGVMAEMSGWDKSYSRLITRTGIVWANNEGAVQKYIDVGITEKQWYATDDELTCPYCAEMHEKIVGVEGDFVGAGDSVRVEGGALRIPEQVGGIQHPPLHPNCRCVILPFYRTGQVLAPEQQPAPEPLTVPEAPRIPTVTVPIQPVAVPQVPVQPLVPELPPAPVRPAAPPTAPANPVMREQSLRSAEQRIILKETEHAVLVDDAGKVVFEKAGGAHSVEFTAQEVKQMKGMSLTHNHPLLAPPSGADIRMMTNGLKEMRMINSVDRVIIQATDKTTSAAARKFAQNYDRSVLVRSKTETKKWVQDQLKKGVQIQDLGFDKVKKELMAYLYRSDLAYLRKNAGKYGLRIIVEAL